MCSPIYNSIGYYVGLFKINEVFVKNLVDFVLTLDLYFGHRVFLSLLRLVEFCLPSEENQALKSYTVYSILAYTWAYINS